MIERAALPDDVQLVILSSPSGAGKSTLTRRLLDRFRDFTFSVSHTTRPPRRGEVDGREYHFVSPERFGEMVDQERFLEWAEVHGNRYGTCVDEIERASTAGRRGVVFDVDYQGARQIKAKAPGAVGIFILPPSLAELERRLRGRASDTEDVIRRRFAAAKIEIGHYDAFDYLVVNDDLEAATTAVLSIVESERHRRSRQAHHAEALLRPGAP